ncbi:MAG: MFS transporter [Chloroflexota bacterium]
MTTEIQQEPPLPDADVASIESVPETPVPHDPYAALRFRDFRLLIFGRFVAALGEQMVSVAIGWELYERTGSAFALGLVGLVQILPVITLVFISGHVADRFNRKRIVVITQILLGCCSLGLAALTFTQSSVVLQLEMWRPDKPGQLAALTLTQGSLLLVYLVLLMVGILRAFNNPAASTLLPQTVPPEKFTSAAAWSSSAWQFAAVFGPAVGGFMIAIFNSAAEVFMLDAVAATVFAILVVQIHGRQIAMSKEAATLKTVLAGFSFVRKSKVILAAITLDMFAVLFGGATALLPVYAKDILQVGPEGLGWLRAAPSLGAVCMVLTITYLPPFKKAGKTLLWAVIGFGAATIVFGLSKSFILSLVALALLGAFDNISVVIRSTLLLAMTPDEMRGRVSAVNSVFIGMSNELGAFESGVAAGILGPVLAVAAGGVGTILVVLWVMWQWPQMRRLGSLASLSSETT